MKNIKNSRMDNLLLSFREIWRFDRRLIFLLIADVFVGAAIPFPSIFFAGRIVDSLCDRGNFREVILYVVLLFGLNYLLTVLSTALAKSREYLFLKLIHKLDNDVSRKCLNTDFEQFNDSSVQDRILMINDAMRGNNFFTGLTVLFAVISQLLTLAGVVCVMTFLNLELLLIAFAVVALQALLCFIRLRLERKFTQDSINDRRKSGYTSGLAKDVACKKDVLLYGMSGYILKKTESFQAAMLAFDRRRIKEGGLIEIAAGFLSAAFQLTAYLLIGIKAFSGQISIGDFSMGVTSLISFMSASSFVTSNIITFNDNFMYVRQYQSFLKTKGKFDESPDQISIADLDLQDFEIRFCGVSFRYPNSTAYVLKNVDLTVRKGEKLGLVGFNGAGKTTLTLLLTRMYDPTMGKITLCGVDIRKIRYSDYLKLFSAVHQDFSLFAFSLLENIAVSDTVPAPEKERIGEILREAGLGERLKKLYRGLDTPVSKMLSASGVDLSGGEREKVAIARALYKDAAILILDEPTAALDPIAERETFRKFAELSKGKTAILISHKIYSTRLCDKIAVLDRGEIREYGSFDELMQKDGLYAKFFRQQAKYYREPE